MIKQENKQEISHIKRRILEYLDSKGVSQYAFHKDSGITRGVLTQTNGLSEDNLHKFLAYAQDISTEWLLFGIGAMISQKSKENAHPISGDNLHTQKPQSHTQSAHPLAEFDPHVSVVRTKTITEADQGIPLIPLEAAAGPFLGNSAQIFDYDCERYVVPEFSKADFLIRVMGDSMEPYYIAGDMVACKKLNLDTFFQWNEVYLIDSEQGVLIKRVKPGSTPATLSLVSDNKAYDPVELERAEVYGLARVLGLLRFN